MAFIHLILKDMSGAVKRVEKLVVAIVVTLIDKCRGGLITASILLMWIKQEPNGPNAKTAVEVIPLMTTGSKNFFYVMVSKGYI